MLVMEIGKRSCGDLQDAWRMRANTCKLSWLSTVSFLQVVCVRTLMFAHIYHTGLADSATLARLVNVWLVTQHEEILCEYSL